MRTEDEKSTSELEVFREFASLSRAAILPGSIQSRRPPEPDILCEIQDQGLVAFELVELCDSNWAKSTSMPVAKIPVYLRSSDPTPSIVFKKTTRVYNTQFPIELLCYTGSAIFTPTRIIIEAIHTQFRMDSGLFRRVWLLNGKTVYEF